LWWLTHELRPLRVVITEDRAEQRRRRVVALGVGVERGCASLEAGELLAELEAEEG